MSEATYLSGTLNPKEWTVGNYVLQEGDEMFLLRKDGSQPGQEQSLVGEMKNYGVAMSHMDDMKEKIALAQVFSQNMALTEKINLLTALRDGNTTAVVRRAVDSLKT